MSDQYLGIVEETTRGADPESGYLFLPVRSGLSPKFQPNDAPRKEFRGQDTALGDASVRRLSSAWAASLEAALYPGAEMGLIFKHLFGFAGSRSVIDTNAYGGMLYPKAQPYGAGAPLADKAIGLIPNTDEEGTTKKQYYGGGRIRSLTMNFTPDEDVFVSVEFGGAGPWVGSPDQAALAGAAFPAAACFLFHQASFYIGSGISRTGSGPDYTAIAPGSMTQFTPDEATLTLTNGLEDKMVLNGVAGASKTHRSGQFAAELQTTVDYRDPSSGFSSADEFKTLFSGPRTNSLLIVLDSGELAGAATQNYQMIIDLPTMLLETEGPERNNEGQTPPLSTTWRSLYNSTTKYPAAILTFDQAAAY